MSDTGIAYVTVKYQASDGRLLWYKRFAPSTYDSSPVAIGADTQGNVFVTGTSDGRYTSEDYMTVKYDPAGNKLWSQRYTGIETSGDLAAGLTVDDDGNLYVAGTSYRSSTAQDFTTVAYDQSGKQLWTKRYDGPQKGPDEAVGIGLDSLGNLYVAGNSMGIGDYSGPYEYTVVKYRASDGRFQWAQRHHETDSVDDWVRAMAVNSKGDVALTGGTYNFTTRFDVLTVMYDTNGDNLLLKRYDGAASRYDIGYGIALDAASQAYVTGYTEKTTSNQNYLTIKYGQSQPGWTRTYEGTGEDWDSAAAVAVDAEGNVYVTGQSDTPGSAVGCVTIKYGPSGTRLWVRRYDVENQANHGKAITVDAGGNVYVAGEVLRRGDQL